MNERTRYYLSRDVYSNVRSSRLYGSKGEPVTVISRSGHVVIVECKNGDRFPVTEDALTENLIACIEKPNDRSEIREAEPSRKHRRTGASKQNPPSLF